MKGEIKEVPVGGKTYELKKQGISESLIIQGLFIRLLMTSGRMSTEIPDDQVEMAMAGGITPSSAMEMKEIIKACVHSPKINNDTYEDFPSLSDPPALFFQIYLFNVNDAEKKTDSQSSMEESPTQPEGSKSSEA